MARRAAAAAVLGLALLAGTADAQNNEYSPWVPNLPAGYVMQFIGCRATNADLPTVCKVVFGDKNGDGWSIAEWEGMQPDRDGCRGDLPWGSWCAVFSPQVTNTACIRSCDDGGNYVLAGEYRTGGSGVDSTRIACLGSDPRTCTWFSDATCSVLMPLSKPVTTVAYEILCPADAGLGRGWCAAAYKTIVAGLPQETCAAPPPPPGCTAPTGGPNYGGSQWTCVADAYGSGTFVPVKLAAGGNAACMSTNSKDCMWTSKDCCESLARTGDGTTPYLECGGIHYAVWGVTGYEDPQGWCMQALRALGGGVPPPPPPPPNGVRTCTKVFEGQCVGSRTTPTSWSAYQYCTVNAGGNFVSYETYSQPPGLPCGPFSAIADITCTVPCDYGRNTVFDTKFSATTPCNIGTPNFQSDALRYCSDTCALPTLAGTIEAGNSLANVECRGENQLYCKCGKWV